MKHYVLLYQTGADFKTRRLPHRAVHLQYAWDAQERGDLVIAGAFADEEGGAMMVFQADSPDVVEAFAKADPYVTEGVVDGYRIREWTTVVGEAAAAPIRP